MQNSAQNLSFQYGIVASVDTKAMTCMLNTASGPKRIQIMHGGVTVVMPKVGEVWTFYVNGLTRVLHERSSIETYESEQLMNEGDVLVRASSDVVIEGNYIKMKDAHGEFFNQVNGQMNPDRAASSRMYMVESETDLESIDGKLVTPPCLLAIVSGSNVTWKAKTE